MRKASVQTIQLHSINVAPKRTSAFTMIMLTMTMMMMKPAVIRLTFAQFGCDACMYMFVVHPAADMVVPESVVVDVSTLYYFCPGGSRFSSCFHSDHAIFRSCRASWRRDAWCDSANTLVSCRFCGCSIIISHHSSRAGRSNIDAIIMMVFVCALFVFVF